MLMVVMAVIAAVAGYAYAGYTVVVAPEIAGFVFGTELVIWVALGGRGTLIGPVLGTIVIDLATAYLSGNLPYIWKLIIGVLFVAVIVALPQGLMPLIVAAGRHLNVLVQCEKGGQRDTRLGAPNLEIAPPDRRSRPRCSSKMPSRCRSLSATTAACVCSMASPSKPPAERTREHRRPQWRRQDDTHALPERPVTSAVRAMSPSTDRALAAGHPRPSSPSASAAASKRPTSTTR